MPEKMDRDDMRRRLGEGNVNNTRKRSLAHGQKCSRNTASASGAPDRVDKGRLQCTYSRENLPFFLLLFPDLSLESLKVVLLDTSVAGHTKRQEHNL